MHPGILALLLLLPFPALAQPALAVWGQWPTRPSAPPVAPAAPAPAAPLRAPLDPGAACLAAIRAAEQEFGLPPRLLQAMARVESGRRDPATGETRPWPWTINAEGRSMFFPTKEAALTAVRALRTEGVRSIDVGCLQINLRYHPDAFASVEEAFDPLANARYAARFLASLQARAGDWQVAAGHYHSQTPELASAYRARIAAAWTAERGRPEPGSQLAAARPPAPPAPGAIAVAALPTNGGEEGQILTGMAGAGRDLAAYRAAPIPLTGRVPLLAVNNAPGAIPARRVN